MRALGRSRSQRLSVLAATAPLILVLCVVSVAVGSRAFTVSEMATAITHTSGEAWLYIRHYRIPRTILALLVGAALGISGALVQAVTRNPLAGPGILGVNSGAALSVVVGISLGFVAPAEQVLLAVVGAAVAALVVFLADAWSGSPDNVRLLLIGTAMGATLESITAGITLLQPNSLEQFRQWAAGSVADRGLSMIPLLAICVVVAAGVGVVLLARPLDILAMGADLASDLGVNRARLLLATGAVVTVLCGAATAAAGPIVFIGLLVPHLARGLVGIELRWVLPTCAVLGALVLLTSDIVGRMLIPGSEIPAGVVSAVIGAPLFFLMIRLSRVRI